MGNKLGRRRQVVEDKYTRPQGLYQHKDVDHKKLRKLILDSKLAPCFPGDDDSSTAFDLEECPICFLYYPSLNRSRCCMKGICTECFLQMKTPNSTRPTQCPFCKTLNYAVEYRGVKTKEEKGMEQIEEQRVIEAKIRMRHKEIQDEEERMQKRLEISSASRMVEPSDVEYISLAVPSSTEGEEILSAQQSCEARQPLHHRQNRDDEFDLDLENIMLMEAIWLSFQEDGKHRIPGYGDASSEHCFQSAMVQHAEASSSSSSSPSAGLACAIAALAERQQMGEESSNTNYGGDMVSFSTREGQLSARSSADGHLEITSEEGEWGEDHNGSEVAVVGTSFSNCDTIENHSGSFGNSFTYSRQDETGSNYQNVAGSIVSENFEEQMMLAMAVSLAEARTRMSSPGVAWH